MFACIGQCYQVKKGNDGDDKGAPLHDVIKPCWAKEQTLGAILMQFLQ